MTTRSPSREPRAPAPHAAGPSGPAASCSERPGDRSVTIAGWLCPGGGWAFAPDPHTPHWRLTGGGRHTLAELLAGQAPGVRARLLYLHAEAIAAIVREAAERKARGESARELIASATRLCRELVEAR